MQRNQKYVSLIYLACGFVTWLLFREVTATVWAVAHLKQPAGWVVPPSEIIAIVIGLMTFVALLKNKVVNVFTNETITELGKVVWPDKKITLMSTGVVSVMVAIAAGILFGFDMLWGAMVRIFYQ